MRASTLAIALCTSAASAQDYTRITVEASTDNLNWSSSIGGGLPLTCYFRVSITKTGPTPVAGLGSIIHQPVIDASRAGPNFSSLAFSNIQNGVPDSTGLPALLGRLNPFAANPMSSGTSGTLTAFIQGNSIRFAGSRCTTPTTNLAWGIPSEQRAPILAGTSFNASSSIVVFKFAATFNDLGLIWVDVPYASINSPRDPVCYWYTSPTGTGNPVRVLVDPADIRAAQVYVGGNPCVFGGTFVTRDPLSMSTLAGRRAAFRADYLDCGGFAQLRWFHDGQPVADSARIHGATGTQLVIDGATLADAGEYTLHVTGSAGLRISLPATLAIACPADLDDGSGAGSPDAGVDINDLLFFVSRYEIGSITADLDDGSGLGVGDRAVTIDDLLYFLNHYEGGC